MFAQILELIRRWLPSVGRRTRRFLAAVMTAAIAAVVASIVVGIIKQSDSGKPAAAVHQDPPMFCTIRGIEDSGYLNAALSGRSPRVVAVAVWIVDEEKWYFEAAKRGGQSWSVPADPTHLWQIGEPGDPPHTSFIFAMLTRTPHTHAQLPGEEEGRRTIPHGFTLVGEKISLQQRDLLSGGYNNRDC